MDERQGSEEKPGRGRWFGQRVLVAYLSTGATLAMLRVSLLAWVEHRTASDQMTRMVYNLLWFLRPELVLGEYTRVGSIHFENLTYHFLFWGSVLTLGSFIIATPILLVGWLAQRRP
jgi:hypothetical protein